MNNFTVAVIVSVAEVRAGRLTGKGEAWVHLLIGHGIRLWQRYQKRFRPSPEPGHVQ